MKKYLIALLLPLMAVPLSAQEFLKGKILYFDEGKGIAERGGTDFDFSLTGGLSTSSSISLLNVERALEKAAEDDDIAMVFLRPDKISGGMAAREELRRSLERFSQSGKPVVCYGITFANGSYYLGSVGDRVFMHPDSEGALTGLSSQSMYYKDLLDTLGIQVELIRHGSYKSAGEPYVRSEMSAENREQNLALLRSCWEPMVEDMAASRGISADSLRYWTDHLALGGSQDWLDKGLVDGLKFRDEMEEYICHLFGKNYPDQLKKVSMSEYIKDLKNKGSKKIAVLYAEGDIVRSGSGIAGEKFSREIAKVRADSTVKAVVFRVNSPGGEVVAAEMIRREIELLKKDKPVIASYGSYAASGGYLISAGADRIIADNTSITGSIGVFGMSIGYGEALKKKLHINTFAVGTNDHSDMGTGLRTLNGEELVWHQKSVDRVYDDFVSAVSEGRGMDKEAVDAIAQGRVWSGKDALSIGLVDERGTLLDAIHCAAETAGLKNYRIVVYPAKKKLLENLMSKEEKKDTPLLRVTELLPQGFSTTARISTINIDF